MGSVAILTSEKKLTIFFQLKFFWKKQLKCQQKQKSLCYIKKIEAILVVHDMRAL